MAANAFYEKRKRNKTESRHIFTISFPQTVLDLTRVLFFAYFPQLFDIHLIIIFSNIKGFCNKLQYFILLSKTVRSLNLLKVKAINKNKWRLISIHLDYSFRLSKWKCNKCLLTCGKFVLQLHFKTCGKYIRKYN